METCDVLVIGAGVVGLAIALELRRRRPGARIVVLEKEEEPAFHGSGRNSGVLHAGFYYSADSLKARFSVEGNQAMKAFCAAHDVPVRACGKLVVTRSEAEHDRLDELLARGARNGVEVQEVTEGEARDIEPRIKTAGRALWSPTTASVEPLRVMSAMAEEAESLGISIRLGAPYLSRQGRIVVTGDGPFEAGQVVNAAGLYADRIARDWGAGERYRIVPFKGLYLYGDERAGPLNVHVYPVPDLGMPFLGVHFTVTPDDHVKIGPTALPALWRENYGGLHRFAADELIEILWQEARMFVGNGGFRRLAVRELPKAFRGHLVRRAADLLEGVEVEHYPTWGRPGIRAQLVDRQTDELVQDFVVEEGEDSIHVLNAVSPAFTCSFPFARHVVDRLEI